MSDACHSSKFLATPSRGMEVHWERAGLPASCLIAIFTLALLHYCWQLLSITIGLLDEVTAARICDHEKKVLAQKRKALTNILLTDIEQNQQTILYMLRSTLAILRGEQTLRAVCLGPLAFDMKGFLARMVSAECQSISHKIVTERTIFMLLTHPAAVRQASSAELFSLSLSYFPSCTTLSSAAA